MQKTKVDPTTCIGCGLCEATCPKSYVIDESTFLSVALDNQEDSPELLQLSIEECPVDAISYNE